MNTANANGVWNIAEGISPDKTHVPTIEDPDVNTSFALRQDRNTKMLFDRQAPSENGGDEAIPVSPETKIKNTVFVCDADGVTVINGNETSACKSYNFPGEFVSDGKIYHGRTALVKATGNNENRTLEVQIQKFEGTSWQLNSDDKCTDSGNLGLNTNTIKNPPPSTELQPLSWDYNTSISSDGKVEMITMTGTGNPSQGPTFNIPITLTPKEGDQGNPIGLRIYLNTIRVPWLKYDSFIDLNYPFAPGNDANRIQLTQ